MGLNLGQAVIDFLKENIEQKFTAREIAAEIIKKYPEKCQDKKSRSQSLQNDADLLQQLVAEIGARRKSLQEKYSQLKTLEERPRKYYFSMQSNENEITAIESQTETKINELNSKSKELIIKNSEHDLYPKLAVFMLEELGIYTKRINEKRASNKAEQFKNKNKWLHPDLVGVKDLGQDWLPEVSHCVEKYFDKRTQLWSFEVKLSLDISNVRESFFQTVSNSSWADFAYLVTSEIKNLETEKELRILSAAHGIGLIWLNVENPSESEIRIPARERPFIDWDIVNRLASENHDFLDYIKLIKQFYQTGEIRHADWDVYKDKKSNSIRFNLK